MQTPTVPKDTVGVTFLHLRRVKTSALRSRWTYREARIIVPISRYVNFAKCNFNSKTKTLYKLGILCLLLFKKYIQRLRSPLMYDSDQTHQSAVGHIRRESADARLLKHPSECACVRERAPTELSAVIILSRPTALPREHVTSQSYISPRWYYVKFCFAGG